MATIYEIKKRADELTAKTNINSIPPGEVGGLIRDLADYAGNVEVNGGTLGIRKVYVSVAAMEADAEPVGIDGKPLKRGNLVSIYDGTDTGADNNKIYAYQKPGWALLGIMGNLFLYTTKEETDEIKALALNNSSDISRLINSVNTVNEPGFHFPDSTGKDVMNYTEAGFDVAKVSVHLLSLILSTGVISEEMLSDEVKELINALNLGEAPGTAYEGDKGKANADAIKILDASIKAMNNSLESVSSIIKVNEAGFHFPDSMGKDVMNYTEKGFDVAKVSSHFLSLILATGVVTSDMLSDEVKKLIASSSGSADYLSSIILKVLESGYHFPDSTGKDVMNYTENGFDVAKVSSHFIEVLNSSGISGSLTYEIINDKIYNF